MAGKEFSAVVVNKRGLKEKYTKNHSKYADNVY